jgi:hypothetical protein
MRIIEPIAINDTILTDSNVPEDDHPEWDASTSYLAGDKVIVISTHRIYEALQATTGDDPATDDGTNWLDIGATNRYRAFDGSIEGQTVQASSIQYEFTLTGNFGGLALLNIIGADSKSKHNRPRRRRA